MTLLSRIDPLPRAIIFALSIVALPGLGMALELRSSYPDSGLMYAIGQVGVAVVLAFVIEAAWMTERFDRRESNHRGWLGAMTGFALAGLLCVASALAVGAHCAAGHANFLDALGLWWSIVSLAMLGAVVVVQPLVADELRAQVEAESD
jgi:MFS family permease